MQITEAVTRHSKKVLSVFGFIIALTIVLSASAAAKNDVDEQIKLLQAIGIMNTKYQETDLTSRSGFVCSVLNLINYDTQNASSESVFSDVKKNAAKINAAYDLKLISGSNGNFNPDNIITLNDAVTVLGRALGYNIQAEQYGGYPNGYLRTATEHKLLTGVKTENGDLLSFEGAVQLLVNALEAEAVVLESIGKETVYKFSGAETVLELYHDIYKINGIVEANINADLYGQNISIGKEQVVINSCVFASGQTVAKNLIGYKVEAYVKALDGIDTILYIIKKHNKVLEIDATELENQGSTDKISYKKNGSNSAEIVRLKDDLTVIFNNRICGAITTTELYPKNGKLVFVDNNADSTYDFLFITSYKDFLVGAVLADEMSIIDEISGDKISLEDYEEYHIFSGETEIAFSDIEKKSIASVAESKDKELCEIIISSTRVTGKIAAFDEETITIGKTEYGWKKYYSDLLPSDGSPFLGCMVNAYVNNSGAVCYIDFSPNTGRTALLIKASAEGNISKKVHFRIMDREDGELILKAADKVKIDGITYSGTELTKKSVTLLDVNYYGVLPIVYKVNGDGEIIEIDTPSRGNEGENSLRPIAVNEEYYYVSDARTFIKPRVNRGVFFLGSATLFAYVPEDASDGEEYLMKSRGDFNDDFQKNMSVFTVGDSRIPDIILVKMQDRETPVVGSDEPIAVVDKIRYTENSSGDEVEILSAYKNGKHVTVQGKEKGVMDGLEMGDIVFYSLNEKGEVSGIAEKYKKGIFKEYAVPAAEKGRMMGRVYYKEADIIGVTYAESLEEPGEITYLSLFEYPDIYVYNEANETVVKGTPDDIVAYLDSPGNASEIFIQTEYSKVRGIVIFR